MDGMMELIFFLVFFVPMAGMVLLNLLLHRTLPDVTAPMARLTGMDAPQAGLEPRKETPPTVPAVGAGVSNDEEALEAA